MFNPETQYDITPEIIPLKDFHEYADDYVVRPPYQRKSVWSRKKQQALLDSLLRRFYVPRIVVRLVRLDKERTVREVIDGQQRIRVAQRFFADELPLPKSLKDVHPDLPGARFSDLSPDLRRFIDKELKYDADLVKGIENPKDPEHQRVASEIFWRLQQGETLNYMEVAHARLSSLSRNFVVKYADDITFDYETYEPIDENPDKHPFFSVIKRSNERMQHLALLTRFLIVEENDGPADMKDVDVSAYIERYQSDDGIGNLGFEEKPQAKAVLRVMQVFYEVFKDDPMIANGNGAIRELGTEYFIISTYMLLRHVVRYYVFGEEERNLFHDFVIDLYQRWRNRREEDRDIILFSDNRQQTAGEIAVRQRIIRQLFFEYVAEKGHDMLTKDERRAFSEAERIAIYRRDGGLCQMCVEEGKPETDCHVRWSEYDADHVIPHSRGGPTAVDNAQVLCRYHNQSKGAQVSEEAGD